MRHAMNIVLATIEYPPQPFSSGIGTYTKHVAEGLAGRGHRVHVLTRGTDADRTVRDGRLTIEYVTPTRPELPSNLTTGAMLALGARELAGELTYRRKVAARLHALVTDEGYDLVEAADHLAEAAWFEPRRHPGVPFVVRLHTPMAYSERIERSAPGWVTALVTRLEHHQAAGATHLSCPAAAVVEPFCDALDLADREVEVYPNPSPLPLRPEPARGDGGRTVLFVGRLTGWKGADTLMRAVPEVLRRFPDTTFLLAGAETGPAHGHDSYQGYLRSLLPCEAQGSVRFLGKLRREELDRHYRDATVCVFPSRFEAQGYTCLEAMSFAKAIVGSAEGGMRELLDEGRAGLLHRPPDPADLADKIGTLLADPDLRAELGQRARERALTTFSFDHTLDAAEEFYERAIHEATARAA